MTGDHPNSIANQRGWPPLNNRGDKQKLHKSTQISINNTKNE